MLCARRELLISFCRQLISTETGFEGAEEGMAMKRAMEVKKMSIFCTSTHAAHGAPCVCC